MQDKVMGRTSTFFAEAYALSDLDFEPATWFLHAHTDRENCIYLLSFLRGQNIKPRKEGIN